MEQVVDGLRLEDFLSPEISRVLQDPKSDPFSSLDQQSLNTTSNPGPSQEITDRFGTITEEEIHEESPSQHQEEHRLGLQCVVGMVQSQEY